MKASVPGALRNLNISWRSFEHNGNRLTKQQVKSILEYGVMKGYKTTDQFTHQEIEEILKS